MIFTSIILLFSHLFSLTNGTTELFTASSNSITNTLIVQYLMMNGNDELQQVREIKNVFLSNNDFHHIAIAVYNVQLTVIVDGVFRLRQVLSFPVVVEAEDIFIGTLNDGENPTLQGVCVCVCVHVCVCVDLVQRGRKRGIHRHCTCMYMHTYVRTCKYACM